MLSEFFFAFAETLAAIVVGFAKFYASVLVLHVLFNFVFLSCEIFSFLSFSFLTPNPFFVLSLQWIIILVLLVWFASAAVGISFPKSCSRAISKLTDVHILECFQDWHETSSFFFFFFFLARDSLNIARWWAFVLDYGHLRYGWNVACLVP